MRSTTIVHRSSAPQIPTPRPDLGRSDALTWGQPCGDDSAVRGTGTTDSAQSPEAWRKGVAHQKIRQAGHGSWIPWPVQPLGGLLGDESPLSRGLGSVHRDGRPTLEDGSGGTRASGTVGRQRRDGKRGSPIPGLASVRDNVPRRSPVIWPVHPRSRSSVGERPPHTRKVAGSIPAGTTTKSRPANFATYVAADNAGCSSTSWALTTK